MTIIPMSVTVVRAADKSSLEIMFELSQYAFEEEPSILKSEEVGRPVEKQARGNRSGIASYETPDFKEIERQAEYASSITGVRKDFLMGMLVVESDMGRNIGHCTYKEVSDGAEVAHRSGRLSQRAFATFQERKKIIQDIASELGYDYENLKVSCNPPYAGTGGALGIAQFMPDTWLEYKDRIAAASGQGTPDPWDIRDGVLAMALKVADVPGVIEHDTSAERAASKMYLSGTTSWRYDWYASQIQYWANNYHYLMG